MNKYVENVFRTEQERANAIEDMDRLTGGPVDVQDGLTTSFGRFAGSHAIYIQVVDNSYAVITAIGPERGYAWLEKYE